MTGPEGNSKWSYQLHFTNGKILFIHDKRGKDKKRFTRNLQ